MSAYLLGQLLATERNGASAGRLDVTHWPVTVGRGFTSDLVLDDAHLAGEHLRIDQGEGGVLKVKVLDTINGVALNGKKYARDAEFAWPAGQALTVGRLKLGMRLPGEALAAEEPLFRFPWRNIAWTVAGIAGVMAFVLAQSWLVMTEPSQLARGLPALLGGVFVSFMAWSGAWALVTKIFTGRAQFWRHVRIACYSSIAFELVTLLLSLLAFMFSLESLSRWELQIAVIGAAVAVYLHLSVMAPHVKRGLAWLVAGIAVLGVAAMLGTNWLQNQRLSNKLYMSDIYPPSWRVAPAVPVKQFMDEAGSIKKRLDKRLEDKENDGEPEEEPDAE